MHIHALLQVKVLGPCVLLALQVPLNNLRACPRSVSRSLHTSCVWHNAVHCSALEHGYAEQAQTPVMLQHTHKLLGEGAHHAIVEAQLILDEEANVNLVDHHSSRKHQVRPGLPEHLLPCMTPFRMALSAVQCRACSQRRAEVGEL